MMTNDKFSNKSLAQGLCHRAIEANRKYILRSARTLSAIIFKRNERGLHSHNSAHDPISKEARTDNDSKGCTLLPLLMISVHTLHRILDPCS